MTNEPAEQLPLMGPEQEHEQDEQEQQDEDQDQDEHEQDEDEDPSRDDEQLQCTQQQGKDEERTGCSMADVLLCLARWLSGYWLRGLMPLFCLLAWHCGVVALWHCVAWLALELTR